jgi:hypothetical protein
MQEKPNKSKQKKLAFPWILLTELGLFNALRRIQTKKSVSLATRVLGCAKRPERSFFRYCLQAAALNLANGKQ